MYESSRWYVPFYRWSTCSTRHFAEVVPVTTFDPMPDHTPERPGPIRARAMLVLVE
jgi:hypothetical protein